jgi:hypothetical protein
LPTSGVPVRVSSVVKIEIVENPSAAPISIIVAAPRPDG